MSKLVVIAIVIIAIVAVIYFERKRAGDLSAVAGQLGLDFQPGMQQLPTPIDGAGFDLFTQGPPNINNLFTGERDGRPAALFEFTYQATSSGEGSRDQPLADNQTGLEQRTQTVVWRTLERPLPLFDLAPRDTHQRTVAGRFGLGRVNLAEPAAFHNQFTLLAQQPEAVRPLFTAALVEQLLALPGAVIEVRGDQLLLYRFQQRVEAKQLRDLLETSDRLLDLLHQR